MIPQYLNQVGQGTDLPSETITVQKFFNPLLNISLHFFNLTVQCWWIITGTKTQHWKPM